MIPTLLIVVMVVAGPPTPGREIDATSADLMTKVMTDPASCEAARAALLARSRPGAKAFIYCESLPQ